MIAYVKLKMIGEIRQNFTEASASVGLLLATALQELLKQQQQQTLALTLPQPEVPVFSGDPTEDSDFIRPLESDPSMKLYYLVQYTPSDVRQLMHGRYSRIVTARVIRLLLLTLNVLRRYGLWHSRFRSNKG